MISLPVGGRIGNFRDYKNNEHWHSSKLSKSMHGMQIAWHKIDLQKGKIITIRREVTRSETQKASEKNRKT